MNDDHAAPSDRTHEGSADRREPPEQQGSAGIARRPATHYVLSPSAPVPASGRRPGRTGIGVLRRYRRSWLRSDLYAGISVVAYIVPQVMAYTALVGVPPVAGLWTALAALIAYAALGTSRVLSVGPESTIAFDGRHGDRTSWLEPTRTGRWHSSATLSLIVGGGVCSVEWPASA